MRLPVVARVPTSLSVLRRAAGAGFAAAAMAAGLTACGGGDQVEKFQPNKIVSFGDESSVLESEAVGDAEVKGLKYTVNSLAFLPNVNKLFQPNTLAIPSGATLLSANAQPAWIATPAESTIVEDSLIVHDTDQVELQFNLPVKYKQGDGPEETVTLPVMYQYAHQCSSHRLWIQLLANGYGLGYQDECSVDRSGAVTYAEAGARVSTDENGVRSIKSQIAAHRSELDSKTLVTVMAGQNDILQEYFAVKNFQSTSEAARARLRAKGRELAGMVNDLTTTGARVLIVTVPNLGLTPYARSTNAQADRDLMTSLTSSFNNGFIGSGGVMNDGNKIGLVDFFDDTTRIGYDKSRYGFSDTSTALCESARKPDGTTNVAAATAPFFGGEELRHCTTANVGGKDVFRYFWADEVNLSPGAHARLGSLAFQRADDIAF